MIKQSYLEVFENEAGCVTVRYAIPDGDKLDIQMLAIHPDDLITISEALKEIANEV